MSGFETRWLDLREPADHAARDGALRSEARAFVSTSDAPLLVDLGCGTGSTIRAFGTASSRFRWRLVDNDPRLLDEAKRRHGETLRIETVEADLSRLNPDLFAGATLVTASALFDLCSETFVRAVVGRLAAARIGLYAVLNYDGSCEWETPHPLDPAMVAAFNAHQRSDKGFGPALGPQSGEAVARIAEEEGLSVASAASPWQLSADHAALQAEFVDGMAKAVLETGRLAEADIEDWRRMRLSDATGGACRVGHRDVLALPRH